MSNTFKQIITLLPLFFLTACGGGGSAPAPSSDASLSALTVAAGEISPVFSPDTTNYTLTVSSDATTVTATVNQAGATVSIEGTSVASNTASAALPLVVGNTDISIVVTAQDGSTSQTYTVTVSRVISLELLDPTPGASNKFGALVVQLANGNIVVSDPGDSSRFFKNGAVHLYSQFSATPIASIYGNVVGDQLGSSSITALGNNNYVIASPSDDENGIVDAGSVRLVDGNTGVQISVALVGDATEDFFGSSSITVLGNNNYVISSSEDDVNGVADAGSERLVDGSTGMQIGATLAGDVVNDRLGSSSIATLGNNNYVVVSVVDDVNGILDAGSVRLVDGNTGVQIGATLAGDVPGDFLGSSVTVLGNNNYVIASDFNDVNGIVDAGSVRLVDGNTGAQIGASLEGDVADDFLGSSSVTVLGNNNYVIASAFDDVNGILNAGSTRLVDGDTGAQIGATLAGDASSDFFGSSVTALGNDHYVIASPGDTVNGIAISGSVRLVDGNTGTQIGATLAGDEPNDRLGLGRIIALGNNNYVIASIFDAVNGIVNAGSVRLVDGSTGAQIGAVIAGKATDDQFGRSGITALANNNYVIASRLDDVNGTIDAGSVRLVDGRTGVQIGVALSGDESDDQLGSSGITALANNNYVIASRIDDVNGIVDAGSVRLVDGSTGVQIGSAIGGAVSDDMLSVQVIKPVSGSYYILSQPNADNGGQVDAGRVRIVVP